MQSFIVKSLKTGYKNKGKPSKLKGTKQSPERIQKTRDTHWAPVNPQKNNSFRRNQGMFALGTDRIVAKENACIVYCAEHGYQYKMIFESDLEKI